MSREQEILEFWFGPEPLGFRREWFQKDEEFDSSIRERFLGDYESEATGELESWEATARGTLALTVVLDQFPRNMFRGQAQAFATDPLARRVAARAVGRGLDRELAPLERMFLYLPFEHSEELPDQRRSVELFAALEAAMPDSDVLSYAVRHWEIIHRFARFPHRNGALGRQSTPEELEFLKEPGSSF